MPPVLPPSHLRKLGLLTGDTRNQLQQLASRQGLEAATGPPGAQGPAGAAGAAGAEGKQGQAGGDSFAYTFDTGTSDADPGAGKLRLNNAEASKATKIFIDQVDFAGSNVKAWITALTAGGVLKLFNNSNPADFVVFELTGVEAAEPYYKLVVKYVVGGSALGVTAGDCVISYAPRGPAGATGEAFSAEIGDGSKTSYSVEHKLGTKRVVVNVYETGSPFAEVLPTVKITDENHVTLEFLTAPSSKQYTVVVVSGAGPQGPAGPAGLTLTYPELISQDAPVNGWDLQDAAGVGSLAATYGAQALSTLVKVTSGVTANPLYKGAKSIHFSGAAEDLASTGAAGALTTYSHMTAEIWVYLPAEVSLLGGCLLIGKNAVTYEGFGVGIGNNNTGESSGSTVNCIFLDPGVAFRVTAGDGQFLAKGWHHFAMRTHPTEHKEVEVFVDGESLGTYSYNGVDHTENERTFIGVAGAGAPNSAEVLFAHAYIYNKRLSVARIRARSDLIKFLQ